MTLEFLKALHIKGKKKTNKQWGCLDLIFKSDCSYFSTALLFLNELGDPNFVFQEKAL